MVSPATYRPLNRAAIQAVNHLVSLQIVRLPNLLGNRQSDQPVTLLGLLHLSRQECRHDNPPVSRVDLQRDNQVRNQRRNLRVNLHLHRLLFHLANPLVNRQGSRLLSQPHIQPVHHLDILL